jgi:isoaspartyl peptidase/L-asparaginase-like protein (Ntn-hydrolase superfamily)
VGDSPIIGAGTYAKNGVCGLGDRPREYFTAQSPRIMCARRSNTAG